MDNLAQHVDEKRSTGEFRRTDHVERLCELLLGAEHNELELPSIHRLALSLISLAEDRRPIETLPLQHSPAELTLVRKGNTLLVSHYHTGSLPQVTVLNRAVDWSDVKQELLRAWSEHTIDQSDIFVNPATATKLQTLALENQINGLPEPIVCAGGAQQVPGRKVPIAFGFSAAICSQTQSTAQATQRADVYSLLFTGELWAYVRGRRINIFQGPVLVAALQLLQLISELALAWEENRPTYRRLRASGFLSAVRLDAEQQATLTLGVTSGGSITLPALDFSEVALPILRLVAQLVRQLLTIDRSQARNLRVVALRNEARELRRRIQTHQRVHCIINQEPERLRHLSLPAAASEAPEAQEVAPSFLRFEPRWRVEVNALEAECTYLCGSRIVVASTRGAMAFDRENGELLWDRRELSHHWMMAGTSLVRLSLDNEVEVCSVDDGRTIMQGEIRRHGLAPITALLGAASITPPVAILREGQTHLVGMDLRNGQLRWRLPIDANNALHICRAGQLLCVVNGQSDVLALDLATGDTVWRFQDRARFNLKPIVIKDTLFLVSGELGCQRASSYGIDLLTGELRFKRLLRGMVCAAPINFERFAALVMRTPDDHVLETYNLHDGSLAWSIHDPGVLSGASALAIDEQLIVNTPWGKVAGLELANGQTCWSQELGSTDQEELPTRLDPVLRGGALFVPSSLVHVLRPSDGSVLGGALSCDLIPDFLRVDERGWVYVGEESGLLSAFAPQPRLRLIK